MSAALEGLRVVEFAQLIGGPLAGTLMADLGAEVVHVEEPTRGDPLRRGGWERDGVGLWWKVAGRNKRAVTLDLRGEPGQALARRLAAWADVVICNYRSETAKQWGVDWDSLHEVNPRLVYLQVSGFGATTSRHNEPGFGRVGEAMSGVVQLTGWPDGPPTHAGFPQADATTAVMSGFAIMAALYRAAHDPGFQGEHIDLALYDTLYRIIDWQVIYYDQAGVLPVRQGNRSMVAPGSLSNTARSADGHWNSITSATMRSEGNIARFLGEEVSDDDTLDQRRARRDRVNERFVAYIESHAADEVLATFREVGIVAARVYTVEDILADPSYAERDLVVEVDDDQLGPVRMQGVVPRLANHPGRVRHAGPRLGADNEHVYRDILGLSEEEYDAYVAAKVI